MFDLLFDEEDVTNNGPQAAVSSSSPSTSSNSKKSLYPSYILTPKGETNFVGLLNQCVVSGYCELFNGFAILGAQHVI